MTKRGPPITIIDAIGDDKLFARWFRDRATWAAWRAFLAALFALPMTPDQLATYQKCTGRTDAPTDISNEAWLVCGRRAVHIDRCQPRTNGTAVTSWITSGDPPYSALNAYHERRSRPYS